MEKKELVNLRYLYWNCLSLSDSSVLWLKTLDGKQYQICIKKAKTALLKAFKIPHKKPYPHCLTLSPPPPHIL